MKHSVLKSFWHSYRALKDNTHNAGEKSSVRDINTAPLKFLLEDPFTIGSNDLTDEFSTKDPLKAQTWTDSIQIILACYTTRWESPYVQKLKNLIAIIDKKTELKEYQNPFEYIWAFELAINEADVKTSEKYKQLLLVATFLVLLTNINELQQQSLIDSLLVDRANLESNALRLLINNFLNNENIDSNNFAIFFKLYQNFKLNSLRTEKSSRRSTTTSIMGVVTSQKNKTTNRTLFDGGYSSQEPGSSSKTKFDIMDGLEVMSPPTSPVKKTKKSDTGDKTKKSSSHNEASQVISTAFVTSTGDHAPTQAARTLWQQSTLDPLLLRLKIKYESYTLVNIFSMQDHKHSGLKTLHGLLQDLKEADLQDTEKCKNICIEISRIKALFPKLFDGYQSKTTALFRECEKLVSPSIFKTLSNPSTNAIDYYVIERDNQYEHLLDCTTAKILQEKLHYTLKLFTQRYSALYTQNSLSIEKAVPKVICDQISYFLQKYMPEQQQKGYLQAILQNLSVIPFMCIDPVLEKLSCELYTLVWLLVPGNLTFNKDILTSPMLLNKINDDFKTRTDTKNNVTYRTNYHSSWQTSMTTPIRAVVNKVNEQTLQKQPMKNNSCMSFLPGFPWRSLLPFCT